jgi:toxin FitB
LEELFETMPVLRITDSVVDKAIELRQARRMSLGDALIAATALHHDLMLTTRNTEDFVNIAGLKLRDPLKH